MKHWMELAIKAAQENAYSPHPNPRVGCVIVKNDLLVSSGFHLRAGFPHAEVVALANAKESVAGSTCYVTLEPCAHQGRTGPCVQALIQSQIAKVVIGIKDINPLVRGKGMEILRANGIDVVVCEELGADFQDIVTACHELNRGFIKRFEQGMPFVRLKMAKSLDGKCALSSGESFWISNEDSRNDVGRIRFKSDAIISSAQTILADNPAFTVRDKALLELIEGYQQPSLVILDRRGLLASVYHQGDKNLTLQILTQNRNISIYTTESEFEKLRKTFSALGNVHVNCVNSEGFLVEVLKDLASKQIQEVLVEAGSKLSSAFVKANLVDELVIYMAPKFMGQSAIPFLQLPDIDSMSNASLLKLSHVERLGDDIKMIYVPKDKLCLQA